MRAMANRNTQALEEWTKIFPRQITESYTGSVTFMKQLTVVALSTITYLKNAFPEDNYVVQQFGGVKMRILKNKCKDEMPQFLSTALNQAFDAFDKKYVYQIALCFYEDECKRENLLEYHILEYTYKDDGVTMSISSKNRDNGTSVQCTFENIKEKTTQLIRACVVMMETFPHPLPETYDVSLRIYYNENAPQGYQAPGYLNATEKEDPLLATYKDSVKLGWVETPYHKLVLRTYARDGLQASSEAIPSQNLPVMTETPGVFETSVSSERRTRSDGNSVQLRCACNNYDVYDAPDDLLTCQYCHTQQHAACYGLTPELARLVTSHCCVCCSDAVPSRSPTDRRLAGITPLKRDCFAIFRRTLWWCSTARSVAAHKLCSRLGISPVSASKLMKLLHNNGIIKQDSHSDLATPSTIIHDQLKAVMSQYFNMSDENDIVTRLMNETLASQEIIDPVGEILSPSEKVSLQNASNIGRVIENNQEKNIEDPTLKQYREALILVERVDTEPLSWTDTVEKLGKKRKADDKSKKVKPGVKSKKVKLTHK